MLRQYQELAVEMIRREFRMGNKRILLQLSTGAGKTVIFSHILKETAKNGKRCLMVVRGRHLVDQAHQRLLREGVEHGVIMNMHKHVNDLAYIQLASIDTLYSRGLKPIADLIVIDEADMATSKSYRYFLCQYPTSYILAVTATPFCQKPLKHVAEKIIYPVPITNLIREGFLVDGKYYCPHQPDLSQVEVSRTTKDYVTSSLEKVMNQNILIGDLVSHWRKYADGLSSLAFAVSIRHSHHIVETFNQAGIPAKHCDADTSLDERKRAIQELEDGKIKVLSNVGIFCRGVDIPFLRCLILARPTKSYQLHIQQLGRGTRIHPGKENFIVLDHSGNILKHGFITDEKPGSLDGKFKTDREVGPKVCKQCFLAYMSQSCPVCGPLESDKIQAPPEVEQGELRELKKKNYASPEQQIIHDEISKLHRIAKEKGYKRGWIYHRLVDFCGEAKAQFYFPKRNVPPWVARKYGK